MQYYICSSCMTFILDNHFDLEDGNDLGRFYVTICPSCFEHIIIRDSDFITEGE